MVIGLVVVTFIVKSAMAQFGSDPSELQAVTNEIAKNTGKGSETTAQAVQTAEQMSGKVNENINQVSAVVATVNSDINRVSQATEEIKSCGLQVRPCATELSGLSKKLTDTLAQFTL